MDEHRDEQRRACMHVRMYIRDSHSLLVIPFVVQSHESEIQIEILTVLLDELFVAPKTASLTTSRRVARNFLNELAYDNFP